MKRTLGIVILLSLLVLVACSAGPETVEVTRVVPSIVEVTRIVTEVEEVEVTRLIEVPVEIPVEVPVTTEVEVTRLVEVEIIVTAVVFPTATPSATPTAMPPTAAGQPSTTGSSLLQAMINVQSNLVTFGGFVDAAVRGDSIPCSETVATYDRVATAPEFNVAGSNATMQNAYNNYRAAVSVFTTSARDMTQNCRDFLAGGSTSTSIPFQQWGAARQGVNDAQDLLNPAIQSLQG
jgi:hypothetical protein